MVVIKQHASFYWKSPNSRQVFTDSHQTTGKFLQVANNRQVFTGSKQQASFYW
jgi:hypothetical protein